MSLNVCINIKDRAQEHPVHKIGLEFFFFKVDTCTSIYTVVVHMGHLTDEFVYSGGGAQRGDVL